MLVVFSDCLERWFAACSVTSEQQHKAEEIASSCELMRTFVEEQTQRSVFGKMVTEVVAATEPMLQVRQTHAAVAMSDMHQKPCFLSDHVICASSPCDRSRPDPDGSPRGGGGGQESS
jgi:hypothetical protein